MTALTQYQRLEGPGLWRAHPDEQRRDVVVALGDASLVITDSRSGAVLSHWSLPAVHRLNPSRQPAIFAPGPEDQTETLELDDETLIGALEMIRDALVQRPRLRHLRRGLGAAAILLALGLGVFWLPGALITHTAGIVPGAKRIQIGREALDTLIAAQGSVRICADPAGRQALTTLRSRVLGASDRVVVVDGLPGLEAAHLPGRLVVLGRELVERLDSPEALAGYMIGEILAAEAQDPLRDLLRHAGIRATFALLTTGNLPTDAFSAYVGLRLSQPMAMPDPVQMSARFDALGAPVSAYALTLPPGAEAYAQALADQPISSVRSLSRMLSDGEWITLQNICQN
ncbi:MAG: hypothetical protein JJU15_05680 [Pararhodobacter sp.]|nr:hypothetical protein [Pararhodobacter sp.]